MSSAACGHMDLTSATLSPCAYFGRNFVQIRCCIPLAIVDPYILTSTEKKGLSRRKYRCDSLLKRTTFFSSPDDTPPIRNSWSLKLEAKAEARPQLEACSASGGPGRCTTEDRGQKIHKEEKKTRERGSPPLTKLSYCAASRIEPTGHRAIRSGPGS